MGAAWSVCVLRGVLRGVQEGRRAYLFLAWAHQVEQLKGFLCLLPSTEVEAIHETVSGGGGGRGMGGGQRAHKRRTLPFSLHNPSQQPSLARFSLSYHTLLLGKPAIIIPWPPGACLEEDVLG